MQKSCCKLCMYYIVSSVTFCIVISASMFIIKKKKMKKKKKKKLRVARALTFLALVLLAASLLARDSGSVYTNAVSFCNRITFDAVAPSVYTTPVETITETGSI